MGYRSEIYEKALKIKADEVKRAQNLYEAQLAELRSSNKDFAEAEGELARLGPTIALAAISDDEEKLSSLKASCDKLSVKKQKILDMAGIVKPTYSCLVCEDSGYAKGALCNCVREIAKRLTFEELSKAMPLGNCSFDSFDLSYYPDEKNSDGVNPRKRATAILALCKRFVNDFPAEVKSLLFMGNTGLGKTHLSLAIVSELSKKGYGVVYGPAQNLFGSAEKEHFSYSGSTEKLDSLLECDLLVIDDLGTEFLSAYTTSLFYNIVNSRLLTGRPTIISTNLNLDELEARYSPRIVSRFTEYEMKEFIGTDIRQQKAFN